MDYYEQMVALYLTSDPHLFISPQYPLKWEVTGIVEPDFVGIDIKNRKVYIVEVSSADNLSGLINKIKDIYFNHLESIKQGLRNSEIISEDWEKQGWGLCFLVFVRKYNVEKFKKNMGALQNIDIIPLEATAFMWEYWEDRRNGNLYKGT